jgi:hypothetical protein
MNRNKWLGISGTLLSHISHAAISSLKIPLASLVAANEGPGPGRILSWETEGAEVKD